MKKPSILGKLKLHYVLPLFECGVEHDCEQAQELGKQLRKFYFGYSELNVETIGVYLMVRFIIIHGLLNLFLNNLLFVSLFLFSLFLLQLN